MPNRLLKKDFLDTFSCKNPNDFDGQFFKTGLFQQPANTSRGCVKTPAPNFGNDQILVMSNFDKMSRRIQWSENEFSHSLNTFTGANAVGVGGSAVAVHVPRPAWFSSWSLGGTTHHIYENTKQIGKRESVNPASRDSRSSDYRSRGHCFESDHD